MKLKLSAREMLTRKRVLHWLQRQPADAMYTTGSSQRCPLAVYLDDDYVVRNTYVVRSSDPAFQLDLPQWAQRFVERVDHRNFQGGTLGRAISRNEALKILRGVFSER